MSEFESAAVSVGEDVLREFGFLREGESLLNPFLSAREDDVMEVRGGTTPGPRRFSRAEEAVVGGQWPDGSVVVSILSTPELRCGYLCPAIGCRLPFNRGMSLRAHTLNVHEAMPYHEGRGAKVIVFGLKVPSEEERKMIAAFSAGKSAHRKSKISSSVKVKVEPSETVSSPVDGEYSSSLADAVVPSSGLSSPYVPVSLQPSSSGFSYTPLPTVVSSSPVSFLRPFSPLTSSAAKRSRWHPSASAKSSSSLSSPANPRQVAAALRAKIAVAGDVSETLLRPESDHFQGVSLSRKRPLLAFSASATSPVSVLSSSSVTTHASSSSSSVSVSVAVSTSCLSSVVSLPASGGSLSLPRSSSVDSGLDLAGVLTVSSSPANSLPSPSRFRSLNAAERHELLERMQCQQTSWSMSHLLPLLLPHFPEVLASDLQIFIQHTILSIRMCLAASAANLSTAKLFPTSNKLPSSYPLSDATVKLVYDAHIFLD